MEDSVSAGSGTVDELGIPEPSELHSLIRAEQTVGEVSDDSFVVSVG